MVTEKEILNIINVSPTQISKYRQCPRQIGFEYVENIKAPPKPWQEFGTAVHEQLAGWLAHAKTPDDNSAGQVAKQGIREDCLPPPNDTLIIEQAQLIPIHPGITLKGFIDCLVPPTDTQIPMVIDHKSTSNLQWAMTTDQLKDDPQALVYAILTMLKYRVPSVAVRWIYYAVRKFVNGEHRPAGILPVNATFHSWDPSFIFAVRRLMDDVSQIVHIHRNKIPGKDLAYGTACEQYGGCFYKDLCGLSAVDRAAAHVEKYAKNN